VTEAKREFFEMRLAHLAEIVGGTLGEVPGAGAAGGLGFGLMAFTGARLEPGFDLVADLLHLEKRLSGADLVVIGEGSFDKQTIAHGKGPARLLALAQENGIPVLVLCGKNDECTAALDGVCIVSCQSSGLCVADSMEQAASVLGGQIEIHADRIRRLLP